MIDQLIEANRCASPQKRRIDELKALLAAGDHLLVAELSAWTEHAGNAQHHYDAERAGNTDYICPTAELSTSGVWKTAIGDLQEAETRMDQY